MCDSVIFFFIKIIIFSLFAGIVALLKGIDLIATWRETKNKTQKITFKRPSFSLFAYNREIILCMWRFRCVYIVPTIPIRLRLFPFFPFCFVTYFFVTMFSSVSFQIALLCHSRFDQIHTIQVYVVPFTKCSNKIVSSNERTKNVEEKKQKKNYLSRKKTLKRNETPYSQFTHTRQILRNLSCKCAHNCSLDSRRFIEIFLHHNSTALTI